MQPTKYPRGTLYWLAVVPGVTALALTFWAAWWVSTVTWQPIAVVLLLILSGILMQVNLAEQSFNDRWTNFGVFLLLIGLLLIPLNSNHDLPVYYSILSISCLLASAYLGWWLERDKPGAERDMAPPDR